MPQATNWSFVQLREDDDFVLVAVWISHLITFSKRLPKRNSAEGSGTHGSGEKVGGYVTLAGWQEATLHACWPEWQGLQDVPVDSHRTLRAVPKYVCQSNQLWLSMAPWAPADYARQGTNFT